MSILIKWSYTFYAEPIKILYRFFFLETWQLSLSRKIEAVKRGKREALGFAKANIEMYYPTMEIKHNSTD